jgi:hypothetical protein
MSTPALPSVSTLRSNDDGRLDAELRVVRLRTQVAVVRTLADEIECVVSPHQLHGLSDQLVEEMARLGRRLFEEAAELTRSPGPEDTGVFHRMVRTE